MDVWLGLRSGSDLRGVVIDVGDFYSVFGCIASENEEKSVNKKVRLWAIKCQTEHLVSVVVNIWEKFKTLDLNLAQHIQVIGKNYRKYSDAIEAELGISTTTGNLEKYTADGFNLFLNEVECETFTYCENKEEPLFISVGDVTTYPCLLFSMDDEVTVIKVENSTSYKIIGKCGINGRAFYQIAKLLSPIQSIIDLFSAGDYCMIDFSNISSETDTEKATNGISTLLFIMLNHIGKIVSLYADSHSINKVFFVRSFIEPSFMKALVKSVKYWSSGKVEAMFLRHDNFVGITGSLVANLESPERDYSWNEMYAFSSGLFPKEECRIGNVEVTKLVLDQSDTTLVPCPQLKDLTKYNPDCLNMVENHEARYDLIALVKSSQFLLKDVKDTKTNFFKEQLGQVVRKLNYFEQNPYGFGVLSSRMLHGTLGDFRREYLAEDIFIQVKASENEMAMSQLEEHLTSIEMMADAESRQREAIDSTVTGNTFDRGSLQVMQIVNKGNFGFREAKKFILGRKWFRNDIEIWLKRVEGPPHNMAAIFIDNSGAEFVLGVVPFSRELIKRGTKVIICAFKHPTLNDVTYDEAKVLLDQVGRICPIVKKALETGYLTVMSTGQKGATLNLRRIDSELAAAMKNVDLVVLIGMGRAVMSNLNRAIVKCDLIRMGTLKEDALCRHLGGSSLSPFFQYEPASN